MKNVIALILLIAGITLLVMGVNTYQEATASLEFLGLDLSAADESGQQTAIIYLALGLLGLVGSYLVYRRR